MFPSELTQNFLGKLHIYKINMMGTFINAKFCGKAHKLNFEWIKLLMKSL